MAATVSAMVFRCLEPVEADESPETVASGHVSVTDVEVTSELGSSASGGNRYPASITASLAMSSSTLEL